MLKPTNERFTHGIAPDLINKDMQINLTFRHLISHPFDLKRPRLQIDVPMVPQHSSPMSRPEDLSPLTDQNLMMIFLKNTG